MIMLDEVCKMQDIDQSLGYGKTLGVSLHFVQEVEGAQNRRIKVGEEMGPKGFAKEILDGLERSVEINSMR